MIWENYIGEAKIYWILSYFSCKPLQTFPYLQLFKKNYDSWFIAELFNFNSRIFRNIRFVSVITKFTIKHLIMINRRCAAQIYGWTHIDLSIHKPKISMLVEISYKLKNIIRIIKNQIKKIISVVKSISKIYDFIVYLLLFQGTLLIWLEIFHRLLSLSLCFNLCWSYLCPFSY